MPYRQYGHDYPGDLQRSLRRQGEGRAVVVAVAVPVPVVDTEKETDGDVQSLGTPVK